MKPFRYAVPVEIVSGPGVVDAMAPYLAKYGGRVLVVTGRHSARANGALDRVLAQAPGAVVFEGVEENPTVETCARGADVCRAHGCDLIVALGGGSALDAGKAIAVLARNPAPCAEYFGVDKFTECLPVIAIPTTAGTGSEVTPYAVIVDTATRVKRTISGRALFPAVAFLDPELSVSMPRAVTIHTGLDALSQAMEGMVSRRATPLGDVLALDTCRLVKTWLARAAAEPSDLEARSQMLFAAMLSGCVIAQSGTTLVHGMGYYFTLEFGLAHGLANALLLAPLFRYNARHEPGKVKAMAEALGHAEIVEAVYAFLCEVGVPSAASEFGVDAARMPEFARDIFADRSRFKNQPGEPSLDEVLGFFDAACRGRVD